MVTVLYYLLIDVTSTVDQKTHTFRQLIGNCDVQSRPTSITLTIQLRSFFNQHFQNIRFTSIIKKNSLFKLW